MPNAKPVYAFVAYYESSPKKENSDWTYLRACPDQTPHEPRPTAKNQTPLINIQSPNLPGKRIPPPSQQLRRILAPPVRPSQRDSNQGSFKFR